MNKLKLILAALVAPMMASSQTHAQSVGNGELPIATVIDAFGIHTNDPKAVFNTFSKLTDNTAVLHHMSEAGNGGDAPWFESYVLFDLMRNGEPYAAVRCSWLNRPLNSKEVSDWTYYGSALGPDLGRPLAQASAQRMVCSFTRWDPESALRPAINYVLAWANNTMGPVTQSSNDYVMEGHLASDTDQQGTGRIWAAELQIPVGGEEAEFTLTTILDLPEPSS